MKTLFIAALVHNRISHLLRRTLLCFLLVGATAAYGGVPSMNVIVSDARGNVAFKGATNSNATFATANLAPGDYVVQFRSKSEAPNGNQYLVVVSAGRKKVIADSVSGNKFNGGGVAMRINVGHELNITGQVAIDDGVASIGSAKVKIINGKRYVWITARTGSNLGSHWEEEGLAAGQVVLTISADKMRKIQDSAFEGSMLDRYRPSYATVRDSY